MNNTMKNRIMNNRIIQHLKVYLNLTFLENCLKNFLQNIFLLSLIYFARSFVVKYDKSVKYCNSIFYLFLSFENKYEYIMACKLTGVNFNLICNGIMFEIF